MISSKKIKHIGIIAGSYEGAALCYRTICNEGSEYLGEHAHPEVSLHGYPLSEYLDHIYSNNWDGVGELMAASAKKLIAIGAEILICPDNTHHQGYAFAKKQISVPWLHIAEEVLNEAGRKNYKKVGLLGTKYLTEGPVYKEKSIDSGIDLIIPELESRKRINSIIFDELVNGIIKNESKEFLLNTIINFKSQGCDSVILGCTEIPLIIFPEDSPLPVLDSTRILARAALKKAIE